MLIIDIVLLVILAGFVLYGLFFGLIRTLGSLIGAIGGLWIALVFYPAIFEWMKNLFFGYETAGKIAVFLVLFVLMNRLICFAFALIDRTFDLLSVIPFLKTINRLSGAALGFVEGGIILGFALLFVSKTSFGNLMAGSKIAPFLIVYAKAIMPLLPGLLNKWKQ